MIHTHHTIATNLRHRPQVQDVHVESVSDLAEFELEPSLATDRDTKDSRLLNDIRQSEQPPVGISDPSTNPPPTRSVDGIPSIAMPHPAATLATQANGLGQGRDDAQNIVEGTNPTVSLAAMAFANRAETSLKEAQAQTKEQFAANPPSDVAIPLPQTVGTVSASAETISFVPPFSATPDRPPNPTLQPDAAQPPATSAQTRETAAIPSRPPANPQSATQPELPIEHAFERQPVRHVEDQLKLQTEHNPERSTEHHAQHAAERQTEQQPVLLHDQEPLVPSKPAFGQLFEKQQIKQHNRQNLPAIVESRFDRKSAVLFAGETTAPFPATTFNATPVTDATRLTTIPPAQGGQASLVAPSVTEGTIMPSRPQPEVSAQLLPTEQKGQKNVSAPAEYRQPDARTLPDNSAPTKPVGALTALPAVPPWEGAGLPTDTLLSMRSQSYEPFASPAPSPTPTGQPHQEVAFVPLPEWTAGNLTPAMFYASALLDQGDSGIADAAADSAPPGRHADGTASSRTLPQLLPAEIIRIAQTAPDAPVTLTLRPEELGTLQFKVSQSEQGLHIHLIVDQPNTLDLLRRQGDQLLADLRQAGFAGASLSFSGNGGQDASARHDSQRDTTHQGRTTADAPLIQQPAHLLHQKNPSGALDLRL